MRQAGGTITISSAWLSRVWEFRDEQGPIAEATRNMTRRTSTVQLADGRSWILMPDGWGRIRLMEGGNTVATAQREDFLGRHWELNSARFAYQLESDSMIRRRWTIGPIGSPIGRLRGGLLSFNTMTLESELPIPFEAVALAWQAIVRPWEAAATGIGPAP